MGGSQLDEGHKLVGVRYGSASIDQLSQILSSLEVRRVFPWNRYIKGMIRVSCEAGYRLRESEAKATKKGVKA